jgi:folate-binding protein YgfZ
MATPETTPAGLTTPLAELHRAAKAEMGAFFGVNLPASFGDFAAEYRAARESVALVDTNFRSVFSLTGPDRVRYLNAVTTGDIRSLSSGQSTLGLLLNAQGHILAELETLVLDDRLLILSHKFVRQRTFETLDKFIIMDDATLTDQTDATGTLALEGPTSQELLRELAGIDVDSFPARSHLPATFATSAGPVVCRLLHRGITGSSGAALLAPVEALPALWNALAAAVANHAGAPIGWDAVNALRLESGVPWFGTDYGDREIPHEAGIEMTHISFTKGCYTGQEIVERVRSRGHVNRRLAGLAFSGDAPAAGAKLTADGAEAGYVTSAAFSPLVGRTVGLGYVRREHNGIGQQLQYGAGTAEIIELPLKK